MKKKELKELLQKVIGAFPIGVLLLMITYVGIYFVAGQAVFESEINQLKNIETLIGQILVSGISWCILKIVFSLIEFVDKKYKVVEPKVIAMLILNASLCIGLFYLNRMSIFSTNVADMNLIVYVVVFVATSIFVMTKKGIDKYLINKKIKELNKN